MVTEPIEALIALLLISIILASIFIYNQRGTERLFLKRTMTRSIAGAVSGFYLYYLNSTNSTLNFSYFENSVANFLSYVEKKEGVSCSVVLRLIFKNETKKYFDYALVNHTPAGGRFSSVNEGITVAYGNSSGKLHVYAIVNRSFISSVPNNSVGIYLVAYYDNGVPALYAGKAGVLTPPWVIVRYDGTPLPPTTIFCSNFTNGRATCDISVVTTLLSLAPSVRTLTIEVHYLLIDGKENGTIILPPIDVRNSSYAPSPMINDIDENNGERYLHYYLGETVNLSSSVSSWRMENRKGEICIYNGPPSAQIPTGSNITCGNIPLPVFLVQGPINITLNYDPNNPYNPSESRQVIFIDPYLTQIFVRTYFRG